jgi:hypothetical protein
VRDRVVLFADRDALKKSRADLPLLTHVYDLLGGVDKVPVSDARSEVGTKEDIAPVRRDAVNAVTSGEIEQGAEARIKYPTDLTVVKSVKWTTRSKCGSLRRKRRSVSQKPNQKGSSAHAFESLGGRFGSGISD